MAIHHAESGELTHVLPLKENLKTEITKTIYKSEHLEVIRMILLAGKTMPSHKVDGDITVQCVEGNIEFSVGSTSFLMETGSLVCLAGGEVHALKAITDSSVILTMVLHLP